MSEKNDVSVRIVIELKTDGSMSSLTSYPSGNIENPAFVIVGMLESVKVNILSMSLEMKAT